MSKIKNSVIPVEFFFGPHLWDAETLMTTFSLPFINPKAALDDLSFYIQAGWKQGSLTTKIFTLGIAPAALILAPLATLQLALKTAIEATGEKLIPHTNLPIQVIAVNDPKDIQNTIKKVLEHTENVPVLSQKVMENLDPTLTKIFEHQATQKAHDLITDTESSASEEKNSVLIHPYTGA